MALALPFRLGVVAGKSMEPALHSGQPFLYAKADGRDGFRKGDLLVVRLRGVPCIKRVDAVGGDRLWSAELRTRPGHRSFLIHPDRPLEQWRRRYPQFVYRPFRIPAGSLFVTGDHSGSLDSRQLGPVGTANVLGRVILPVPARQGPDTGTMVWTPPRHGRKHRLPPGEETAARPGHKRGRTGI